MADSADGRSQPTPSSWGAGLLLAVPLSVLAVLPWCVEAGRYSVALSATLGAVAALLVWRARPQPRGFVPSLEATAERGLVGLTSCWNSAGRGDRIYAVEHVEGPRRQVLAGGENPAHVLEHAFRHAERTGTTLRPGWGLDAEDIQGLAATASTRRATRRLKPASSRAPRFPGARGATITMIAVSLVVLTVTTTSALFHDGQISTLSLLLAAIAVTLPMLLAALTSVEAHVVVDEDRVVFFRTLLGWRHGEVSFAADDVLHVCAASPRGRFHKHLLLRTVFGLSCIECADARGMARVVHASWNHTGGRGPN